jgi:hypothetical protein
MGKLWIGETNGCWVDIWDKPGFAGNYRRLCGPADFPYLRIAEPGWESQVQSLVVGPNAYAQFYEDLNFHDSVFWALPNQRVEDVAVLGCNDEIDSLRIFDRPPFAHEPGYSAYMLWAASHLTRASQTPIFNPDPGVQKTDDNRGAPTPQLPDQKPPASLDLKSLSSYGFRLPEQFGFQV